MTHKIVLSQISSFITIISEWYLSLCVLGIYISVSVMVSGVRVCFCDSVPVRGGSADSSDIVILGVSEPSLHWHALSFGELVPPPKQTQTHSTA